MRGGKIQETSVHSTMKTFTRCLAIAGALALAGLPAALFASAARSPQQAKSSAGASKSTSHKKKTTTRKRQSKRMRLPKAPTRDRISEIQTALARGGFYRGDPNGKWDAETVAAVQKFQSANHLDSTGKLDAPTLQKLGLGSDIAGVSAPKTVAPPAAAPSAPAPAGNSSPAGHTSTSSPSPSPSSASNSSSASGSASRSSAAVPDPQH